MWARVTAGQSELAACCRANTTRERTPLPWREGEEERGWREGWVMTERPFLQLREKKRVYPFAEWGERGNNRWVSCLQFPAPNQTSREITLYSQWQWSQAKGRDRSTPTYMCSGSLLMSPAPVMLSLLHFPSHTLSQPYRTHQGPAFNVLSTLFPFPSALSGEENIFLSGTWEKHKYQWVPGRIGCGLHAGCLASREGTRCRFETGSVFRCRTCDSASALWFSARSRRAAADCTRLLPGGHKLIIHTLSHESSHTYCNPDIPPRLCSAACLLL